ncbi:MAG: pantetheine-phosphate adenylyltransferase [Nitrosarchaeum sp.]|nr:pantetheine-phosphate adenylyltransferase [Nitrosarchaeum sp.]
MKKAIYPLSADPITYGHLNIIERSLNVFDEILVGIGINKKKNYTFTLEEREQLAKTVLAKYGSKIQVKSFTGLLVDFAYENDIKTIVRGVRNAPDFSFEQLIHDINHSQNQGIDTFIVIADQNLSHISSSAVKELQINQGSNIIKYVPMPVKHALEVKLSQQHIIGITGEIGAGKSFIANCILKANARIITFNIDLDKIGHEILENAQEPVYQQVRTNITKTFGPEILTNDLIDVKKLGTVIFHETQARIEFNRIMREPMYLMLRKTMYNKKGYIFVNSALLAEEELLEFVNNNVVFVTASDNIRRDRLMSRGYSSDEINRRVNAQLTAQNKIKLIEQSIEKHNYGSLVLFNNDNELNRESIDDLMPKIYEMGAI